MEKDAEDSNSDEIIDVCTVDQDSEGLSEFHSALLLEKRRLCEKMILIKGETEKNRNLIQHLENFGLHDAMPQFDFPATNMVYPDSPMASPIHEPKVSSDDSFEVLDSPSIQEGSSKQSEAIYNQSDVKMHHTITESNNSSTQKAPIYVEIQNSAMASPTHEPQNASDNETESARTGAKVIARQSFTNSEESYDGKGKCAANPKYRYKKRSKPEASTMEIPSHETPVKPSKEEFGASGQKTFELESPEVDVTRISPAVKRKELASDEGCSTWISTFSGNSANNTDDLQVAKKLKFDDEKASNQCSTVATLLQNDYKMYDSSKNVDQSQTDQSRNESEHLKLPYSRGLSNVSSYASSSEESSHFSEIACRERKLSTLSSKSEDVTCGETEESSVRSRSYYVTRLERQESSQSNASFCAPCSERAESSLASVSDDAMFREIEESDGMFREIEESSLTSVNAELPLGEIRESYLTTESDLSELIASTSYEQSENSQRISQPQIDQRSNESEQLNLPSSSGLSKVVSYASFDEHSLQISGKNYVTCKEKGQSSLTNASDDVTCSDRKDLSLTSRIDDGTRSERDVTHSERDATHSERDVTRSERDVTRGERDVTRGERDATRGERDATRGERDATRGEREESSLSSCSDDFALSGLEESTLTLRESFLTSVSDLSELIADTSGEVLPSIDEDS